MLYKLCYILGGIQCSWASERIANKEIKLMSEICRDIAFGMPQFNVTNEGCNGIGISMIRNNEASCLMHHVPKIKQGPEDANYQLGLSTL